jgi:WD40 repeat protein
MKKYVCKLLIPALFIIMFLPKAMQAQRPELIIPATHSAFSAVISPDEKWLVSAGAEGIKIWDNKTNRLIKNLAPGSKDNNRFDGGRINMAIDVFSSVLAMQVVDTIYFFDFEKFTITGKIKVNGKRTAFVFAGTKTLYAAGYYEGDEDNYIVEKLNIGNAVTTTLVLKWEVKTMATHNISKLSISAAANELLIYDAVIGSWVMDIYNNKIKKQFKTEQNFAPYSYLPNGNYLALSGKREKQLIMAELDSKSYLPVKKSKIIFKDDPDICAMEYTEICPSASGKMLLYYQNDFVVFNAADFSVSSKKQFPDVRLGMNNNMNIVVSPSGNYYLQSLNMTKNNISNNVILSTIGEFPLDTYVQFVYKNIDGVCLKDRILTFDNGVFNQRMVEPVVKDESGFIYRITNDGKTGFIYNQYWGLYRFDPTKAKIEYESVAKINNMNKKFVGMQIFEAANLLALIGNEGIYVMDLKTLKVLYIVDIPYGLQYTFFERLNKYCDISPDNTKMILFAEAREDQSNFIYCVDLADRNEKWKYESKNIQNIRFTKNGKTISFTSDDKLFYLNAETGKQEGSVVQLPKSDYETIIAETGNIAATKIPIDTNIRAGFNVGLIDIVNNKPVGTLQGTGDDVWGFVFLRNERYMLTEEYGGLCLWDVTRQRKIGRLGITCCRRPL